MTYTAAHMYMTVIGDCYGTLEKWQFGLRLTDTAATTLASAQAAAPIVSRWWRGDVASYTAAVAFGAPSTHRLTEVKVARIQPDGKYPPAEASASVFYSPAIAGTITPATAQLPQSTAAVTLRTNLPRGLASKGRIYLPPSIYYLPGTDGLLPGANAQRFADGVRIMINELNADATLGSVSIFSRGRGVKTVPVVGRRAKYTYPNPGATQPVTAVWCGRVVDTQRRRRRSLTELPVVSATAVTG